MAQGSRLIHINIFRSLWTLRRIVLELFSAVVKEVVDFIHFGLK